MGFQASEDKLCLIRVTPSGPGPVRSCLLSPYLCQDAGMLPYLSYEMRGESVCVGVGWVSVCEGVGVLSEGTVSV